MENSRLVKGRENCSGCGACRAVCPACAITMQVDDFGCLYPHIDPLMCVDCGKCQHICPYQAPEGEEPFEVYAALGTKALQVRDSASGGVFAALASACVAQGGAVAGAIMECGESIDVYHLLSHSSADIPLMQGSKYVQSDASACYDALVAAVKNGEQVFFCGTPCQVAAVKKLTNNPDNLITADLICHGVPSGELLEGFTQMLSARLRGIVREIRFRDKASPKPFTAAVRVEKGRKEQVYRLRSQYLSYYRYFLEGHTYRENCYSCPYANARRVADLTLGDFWGIEKYYAKEMRNEAMPCRTDWSCLLVNTRKGKAFLEKYGEDIQLYPAKLPWVLADNHQLRHPSEKTEKREKLLAAYRAEGYAGIEKIFMQEQGGTMRYYWRLIKHIIRNQRYNG